MNEAKEQNNKRPKDKEARPTRSFNSSVVWPGRKIGLYKLQNEEEKSWDKKLETRLYGLSF